MRKYSDADYAVWYENMMRAKKADVVLSIDRDNRQIMIHSACDGWKHDCLWEAICDFDSPNLVGLSFERGTTPDTFLIEVNASWDIDKLYAQIIERIKLEGYGIKIGMQDTSI